MARGRRLLGQLVLVLAVTAGAFVGAKLGLLSTREVGASHNFEDVPDDAFFHDFVQFLVDNMITAGCSISPPRYCGDDPVTRGQMAVFLKKLSDLVDQRVAALVATNTDALQGQITALQTVLVAALGDTPCVRREGTEVIFEGCNVHVRSGAGATDAAVNGLGNLIVGYNEITPAGTENRTGSHNLVVGPEHTYSSYGGFVAGVDNTVSGTFSSVSGGFRNGAFGNLASVSGGQFNRASGDVASVSGGQFNLASGFGASVSGGDTRTAGGGVDWVAGALFQDQ